MLLDLIKKQKSRFRLAPDGRLSFTPQHDGWDALTEEIIQLLQTIHDRSPKPSLLGSETVIEGIRLAGKA